MAPLQWNSFYNTFFLKPFVSKIWEIVLETKFFEGKKVKTLEKILKCKMP
jgi:hypothetical protein